MASILFTLVANGLTADKESPFPRYESPVEVAGKCRILYSDPLRSLILGWREEFLQRHKTAEVQAVGFREQGDVFLGGTLLEHPDLWITEGFWKGEKLAEFRRLHGFDPQGIPVGLAIYSVIVNAHNPIGSLSVKQLNRIYAEPDENGSTWGNVGLGDEWFETKINPHMRAAPSLLNGFFKRLILNNGGYRPSVMMHGGMTDIVTAVKHDKTAIGCVPLGYVTHGVRVPAMELAPGQPAVQASAQAVQAGLYPLSDVIYVTSRSEAGRKLSSVESQFIKFLFSREGQDLLPTHGYTQAEESFIRQHPAYQATVDTR